MRRKIFASFGIIVSALAIIAASGAQAMAATAGSGNALRVSPVRTDLEIKPGNSKTIDVYVTNMSSETVTLHPVVNDFVAGKDESGTPNILLDGNQAAPLRSFKKYASPLADFSIKANEQHDVKVTITIPADADAGGYYGAVRFEPADVDSSKNLSLSASVGSLVLVTVPGNLVQQASIASLETRTVDSKTHQESIGSFFTSGKNLVGAVRIKNTGNVQVQPFGKIQLKKSGKVVATYEINNTQPRGNVLPDSIRRFEFDISTKATSFGKYTLEANLGYGDKGQLLTATKTFYVVPIPIIVTVVVILALIAFAVLVLPKMIKSYNRRIVQKATGTSTKKKK
ncbi:MAG TPA: DUF916 domain-containing protein [Candidatus Saccharimonadales bacterium]|nr:DUF916 domain-containing protein [Candidatus Saccharimonadales bacterium]